MGHHRCTARVTVFTPPPSGGTSEVIYFTIAPRSSGGQVITAQTATTSSYLGYSITYLKQGQSVKALGTGISQVAVALARKGTPSQALTLSVRSTLRGPDLATATITSSMVISTDSANPTWVTVPLTAGGLIPDNTYYFILLAPSGDLKNYYWVPVNSQNPFKDGIHYKGTGLSDNPGSDLLVKVWFTA